MGKTSASKGRADSGPAAYRSHGVRPVPVDDGGTVSGIRTHDIGILGHAPIRPSVQKARGKGSRRVYSFEDLVELRVVARLLSVGVSLTAVRTAVAYLRSHFTKVVRPLAGLLLVANARFGGSGGNWLVSPAAMRC
jgi:hypothetical protein